MSTAPALHYDRLVEAAGHLGESHQWMIGKVPPGSRVLDVGCAGGYVARVLRDQKECVVDGIEMDPESAEHARASCRSVQVGSLDDSSFLDSLQGSYDRVLCGDILEHLRDPAEVLRTVLSLLAPNGRLLVSIPNVAHWRLRLSLLRGAFDYDDSGLMDRTHLRFYTYPGVARLVQEAGYRIVDQDLTIRTVAPEGARHRYRWPLLRAERALALRFPNLIAYQTLLELAPRE